MAKNPKSKMAAILNLGKSGIFSCNEPGTASVCQRTKFEANIFINDRYMAKKSKSKMAAAAILNFGKSGILGYRGPDMVILYHRSKFETGIIINDWDMAKKTKI